MTPLLLSALFPESGPAELATLGLELGFAGLDLAVIGRTTSEATRTLAQTAGEGLPVRLISCDSSEPSVLGEWSRLAADHGLGAVRAAPLAVDAEALPSRLAELAAVGETTGVTLLIPHHPGSAITDVPQLAAVIESVGSPRLAGVLAPDYVARSRAGDHAAWLSRIRLPPLGALVLAGYRWDSEIGSGNLRVWSPRLAHLLHGLTPWTAWLQRLAETDFDGWFTFGDAALTATLGERLRTVRDDLRVVRRTWRGGESAAGGP